VKKKGDNTDHIQVANGVFAAAVWAGSRPRGGSTERQRLSECGATNDRLCKTPVKPDATGGDKITPHTTQVAAPASLHVLTAIHHRHHWRIQGVTCDPDPLKSVGAPKLGIGYTPWHPCS